MKLIKREYTTYDIYDEDEKYVIQRFLSKEERDKRFEEINNDPKKT